MKTPRWTTTNPSTFSKSIQSVREATQRPELRTRSTGLHVKSLTAMAMIAGLFSTTAYAGDADIYGRLEGSLGSALEAFAKPEGVGNKGNSNDETTPTVRTPTEFGWMSPGLFKAWVYGGRNSNGTIKWDGANYGQGVNITAVDDFSSRTKHRGTLGDGDARMRHGEWTLKQAGMVAPSATLQDWDFTSGDKDIALSGTAFDVLNLSYGYIAPLDRALEFSIVAAAAKNTALLAKSAGNEYGKAVGERLDGGKDYFSLALIDTLGTTLGVDDVTSAYDPVLFVGALDWNVLETSDPLSKIASYSSVAGTNINVQRQFLVVGVEAASNDYSFGTGLAGTSFAAPIIAGYAAVLSSKFSTASPNYVAGRLLETAVTNTISGYDPKIHGQGEADIFNAITPDNIR